MSAYHRILIDRLNGDLAFAFDFARRFRPVPPIDGGSVTRMCSMLYSKDPELGAIGRPSLLLTANTLPGALPPPGGEPWPERWGVLIDTFVDREFRPELLLAWPLLHAALRDSFGFPITHIALCPTWDLATSINRIFAIEPELMPIVVTASTFDDLPADIRRQVEAHLSGRGTRKSKGGKRRMN